MAEYHENSGQPLWGDNVYSLMMRFDKLRPAGKWLLPSKLVQCDFSVGGKKYTGSLVAESLYSVTVETVNGIREDIGFESLIHVSKGVFDFSKTKDVLSNAASGDTGKEKQQFIQIPSSQVTIPADIINELMGRRADALTREVKRLRQQEEHQAQVIERLSLAFQKTRKSAGIVIGVIVTLALAYGAAREYFSNPMDSTDPKGEVKKLKELPQFQFGSPYQKAETLYVHDFPERALQEINRALEDHMAGRGNEHLDNILILRGQIYQKLGQHRLAINDMEEAARHLQLLIQPEPWGMLLKLYEKVGDEEKAGRLRFLVERIMRGGEPNRLELEAELRELVRRSKR